MHRLTLFFNKFIIFNKINTFLTLFMTDFLIVNNRSYILNFLNLSYLYTTDLFLIYRVYQ